MNYIPHTTLGRLARFGSIVMKTSGLESIRWLGPKIWALIPEEVKKVTSLDIFKLKIKEFSFNDCPCSLCKDYISGVGFIN